LRADTIEILLPKFVIDSELQSRLPSTLFERVQENTKVTFNWKEVFFFDDYTLLKLVFIQYILRGKKVHVSNQGFRFRINNKNKEAVIRNLWIIGFPELITSSDLYPEELLENFLKDEQELLETKSWDGNNKQNNIPTLIPILCSNDDIHFKTGSREEKLVESFIWSHLSLENSTTWDLIDNHEFRHKILQQLRLNIQYHAKSALGLSILRVWNIETLSKEWALETSEVEQLKQIGKRHPVIGNLGILNRTQGLLEVSCLDNGIGIIKELKEVYKKGIATIDQFSLLGSRDITKYVDKEFEKRFLEPAAWEDPKHSILAFATDHNGTSKPITHNEIKGLQHLRSEMVISKNGAMLIESDGVALHSFSKEHEYGIPDKIEILWSQNGGGTGINVSIPLQSISSDNKSKKAFASSIEVIDEGIRIKRIIVRDLHGVLTSRNLNYDYDKWVNAIFCETQNCKAIDENPNQQLTLIIVDWGELPDSKDILHKLLIKFATMLMKNEVQISKPFVFANLPKGLCGLVEKAISTFSDNENPIPICVFTSERKEYYWLGLDFNEDILSDEYKKKINPNFRQRKITDRIENFSEAICRHYMNIILNSSQPISLLDKSFVPYDLRTDSNSFFQTELFKRIKKIVKNCNIFKEEMTTNYYDNSSYPTNRYFPVNSFNQWQNGIYSLFQEKFREIFKSPPICFTAPKNAGILIPFSNKVVHTCYRSAALVDSSIAMELAQELISISLGLACKIPNKKIDWVVSCTSYLLHN